MGISVEPHQFGRFIRAEIILRPVGVLGARLHPEALILGPESWILAFLFLICSEYDVARARLRA